MKGQKTFLLVLMATLFIACGGDDVADIPQDSKSNQKQIVEFTVNGSNAQIDESAKTISLTLPSESVLTKIQPVIKVSDKATINPPSGTEQDFSNSVVYTVRAEDGSEQKYTATLKTAPVSYNGLLGFSVGSKAGDIDGPTDVIFVEVAPGTDITQLKPQVSLSLGATVNPSSGVAKDFTHPVTYTVTAKDGAKRKFTVIVKEEIKNAKELLLSKLLILGDEDGPMEYSFQYDNLKRLIYLVRPEYYVYTTEIKIVYDNIGKVKQLIYESKESGVTRSNSVSEVTYIDSKTIHVLNTSEDDDVQAKPDIIKLNDDGRLISWLTGYYSSEGYEYDENPEYYELDSKGNIVKVIYSEGDYSLPTYDDKNGMFKGSNTPQWVMVYLEMGILSSSNNVVSAKEYSKNGQLDYEYYYNYFYNNRTNYPEVLVSNDEDDGKMVMVPYYIPK